MNRNRWLNSHTSPGRDPVLLAMQALAALGVVVIALLIGHMISHARAEAAHPCPSWNFPILTPTGWGCAMTWTGTGKSR